jgi:manganese/zinc/iron transport system substrate-binding protein
MPNFVQRLVLPVLALAALTTGAAAPQVVATTGMIGDVAADVAGTCLEVTTLMGPGVDPHLYRATARDVQTLQRAELVLYHGLDLEGQLAQVLERLGARVPTLAVGAAVIPEDGLLRDETGVVDPHVWMDPTVWAALPPLLADRFAALAEGCIDELRERADGLVLLLDDLDGWIGQAIDSIPAEARVLVTAHDAFAYFARRYGLEVVAIQGISTEAEASVRDVRETADVVVAREVPAVFFETSISPRTVEAVIAAARDRGADVVVGGELYGDALGARGSSAGTYVGMIVHTVATIAQGLGGTVPGWGDGPLAEWAADWDDLPPVAGSRP